MNNNTQMETVEDFTEKIVKNLLGVPDEHLDNEDNNKIDFGIRCINWQKQQDEAKYKELLDSHNELLEVLKQVESNCSDAYSDEYMGLKMLILVDKTINKAKNIKL